MCVKSKLLKFKHICIYLDQFIYSHFRIVKAHPAIGHAVMQIAASVNREGAGAASTSSSGAEGKVDILLYHFHLTLNIIKL